MNRGAQELGTTLTEHGSKIVLARKVGMQPYQLSHILKGERRPNYEQRAWFEDNLGIGWRLWDVLVVVPKSKMKAKVKRPVLTAKPLRKAGLSRKSSVRGAA